MNEQARLRYAGILGVTAPLCLVAMLLLRPFPFPDNNVEGRVYLAYMLPFHAAEWQVVLSLLAFGSGMLIVLLLALVYIERAQRITFSALVMIATSIGQFTMQALALATFIGIALLGRGYPAFGSHPADYMLITLLWNASNLVWTMSAAFPAMTWLAIASANRNHQVLPKLLGGALATTVGVINFASIAALFVPAGRWSPAGPYHFLLQSGTIWLWILATSLWLIWRGHRSARGRPGLAAQLNP
ncbi:hypothetical protein J2W27_005765 [Variovorax boronicumulans]|uniref:hypothetical protein n=1 Tax=Variovorax boronicumulans TaxID=436515 RepID=UPI0027810E48|nr:hypothetical protein [Variovorax boronicumulans]MDP9913629.1 hypothetical protein [Variovorax boronicumulans]